ncbi:unnamed protein product [Musa hybrid cultivar]
MGRSSSLILAGNRGCFRPEGIHETEHGRERERYKTCRSLTRRRNRSLDSKWRLPRS